MNQKQIRGIFGRLSKDSSILKGTAATKEQYNNVGASVEKTESVSSDGEAAEDYLAEEQEEEERVDLDEQVKNPLDAFTMDDQSMIDSDGMDLD